MFLQRRLLRDFHVVSVTADGVEGDINNEEGGQDVFANYSNDDETPGEKFQRLASVAVVINSAKNGIMQQSSSGRQIKTL